MKRIFLFIKDSYKAWHRCNPGSSGAALAYYVLFSFPPIIIILIACAGLLLSRSVIEVRVMAEIQGLVGQQAAELIKGVADGVQKADAGLFASIISVITIIVGSVGAFSQIETSLNQLWHVPETETSGIRVFIREKVVACVLVMVLGFLLLVSMILSTILSSTYAFVSYYFPVGVLAFQVSNTILSLVLASIIFMFMYRFLPHVKISKTAILYGGFITAVLFSIGKYIIEWYLSSSVVASAYGAASAIVVILLWAYYSSQVFLFGAAITYTIDRRRADLIINTTV